MQLFRTLNRYNSVFHTLHNFTIYLMNSYLGIQGPKKMGLSLQYCTPFSVLASPLHPPDSGLK